MKSYWLKKSQKTFFQWQFSLNIISSLSNRRYGSVFQPQSHVFVDKLLNNLEGKQREGALNMIRDLHMLEVEVPRTKEGTILRTQMDRDFDLKEVIGHYSSSCDHIHVEF